ncbi:MAG: sugar ABC transporter permease [Erysipelotrichales bacterium]|nr:sugar ABC transporter permease [Erysipelotrichales bacterium]MBQ2309596.1 sugar ABC transporter permease [Erysipelotrichales bacterium]MBQ2479097.1 sugar ABC transporter permease [Erysipelotrichales bacterium]MBQ4374157.1 sugar ABC transporter permease [Erysipelotrichales bacterium]MBQ5541573.1 sugar ABC transporter permease [Erysipelotrichales bacterium]
MAAKNKSGTNDTIFNRKFEPLIYLIPFALGLVIFTLYPVVNVVIMSFKEGYRLSGAFTGWGIGNFTKVIGDKNFAVALKNTFIYVFTVVPVSTVLSVLIANLLNKKIKGIAFFHTAFFLPLVTSSIAVGLVFKYMFNKDIGIINTILTTFGAKPIDWLGAIAGTGPYNLAAVIIFGIWNIMPFTIILLLSGLQNIDPLYYTAAEVDGANSSTIFRRITVPLLMPTIFLTMIVNLISSFKVYNEVIPFWRGAAGVTGRNLYTMVYYIKEQFYANRQLGRAAAASIILFFIIFAFTMLQRWVQKKFDN